MKRIVMLFPLPVKYLLLYFNHPLISRQIFLFISFRFKECKNAIVSVPHLHSHSTVTSRFVSLLGRSMIYLCESWSDETGSRIWSSEITSVYMLTNDRSYVTVRSDFS